MIVIVAVALVVVGPDRLPRVLRQLGRWYGQARRAADELRRAFVLEADRQDAAERYAKLRERRERAKAERDASADETAPSPDDEVAEHADEDVAEPPAPSDGPVAQPAPFVEPPPIPEGEPAPAEDPNAHAPDAPHPTRPTPLSGEMP